jgi:hypothetical protein
MSSPRIALVVAFCTCLLPTAALAEPPVERHPGYFPLEEMKLFNVEELEADVDLAGAALQMVAGAVEQEDSSLAELVGQLERIRVRVGPIAAADRPSAEAEFQRAISELEAAGWSPTLRVNAEEALVRMYTKEADGLIVGLTVLVSDDFEEAVLVNIVGRLDPRLIGRLIASMDELPDLDELGVDLGAEDPDTE